MTKSPRDRQVFDSVLDSIGWTPLIRLTRVTKGIATPVWVKAETRNPGGSIKDRISIPIIERAEREGKLKPGGTIVEGTSGNTGVALAIAAAITCAELGGEVFGDVGEADVGVDLLLGLAEEAEGGEGFVTGDGAGGAEAVGVAVGEEAEEAEGPGAVGGLFAGEFVGVGGLLGAGFNDIGDDGAEGGGGWGAGVGGGEERFELKVAGVEVILEGELERAG